MATISKKTIAAKGMATKRENKAWQKIDSEASSERLGNSGYKIAEKDRQRVFGTMPNAVALELKMGQRKTRQLLLP